MANRIQALCEQLLRAEDITVIEVVAEELQAAIQAHVEEQRFLSDPHEASLIL